MTSTQFFLFLRNDINIYSCVIRLPHCDISRFTFCLKELSISNMPQTKLPLMERYYGKKKKSCFMTKDNFSRETRSKFEIIKLS